VAVKACHAPGKTYVAGGAVLWFLSRYPDAIVLTTAPGIVPFRVEEGPRRRLAHANGPPLLACGPTVGVSPPR